MESLTHNAERNHNFRKMKDEYKFMYKSFKREYKLWQIFTGFYVLAFFYNVWIFLDEVRNRNEITKLFYVISGILTYVLPCSTFISSAASLNYQYGSFCNCLNSFEPATTNVFQSVDVDCDVFALSMISVYSGSNNNHPSMVRSPSTDQVYEKFTSLWNRQDLLFLIQYIENYPIEARLFSMKVTKINTVKFVAAFIIAKLVSYSLYYKMK